MRRADVARRIASLFEPRALRGYVFWKIRMDPVYEAVLARLRGRPEPLVDVGCGVGLLAFFLREGGVDAPVIGLDFDDGKIEQARRAAKRYRDVHFVVADGRAPLPDGHNVVLLDVLQYFDTVSRRELLTRAAEAAPAGGVVIVREGIRDGSWRYRITSLVDRLARIVRWLKAEQIDFPSHAEVTEPFTGFDAEIVPLRGRTPFNNYLFVFTRRAAAHRPE